MLEAGGVTEPECLREAEDMLFLKMFFRYLHKHHKRVFLLFDEEEILQKVTSFIREDYRDMKIVDCVVLDGQGSSEEMIVNQINGVETDCVMAFMSSPEQEAFLSRNRALINTKIWLGLGRDIYVRMKENTWFFRLKKFLTSHFLKRKIEKEQRKL